MFLRDHKDVAGGGALAITGIAFAWYTLQHYDLGTPGSMGPGMFPAALGVVLGVLGSSMAVLALFQRSPIAQIGLRAPFFVLAGVAAFALVLPPFGLIPAVLAVTVVSSFAETTIRPVGLAVLGGSLCLMAWLMFGVGLRLPITMLSWPF